MGIKLNSRILAFTATLCCTSVVAQKNPLQGCHFTTPSAIVCTTPQNAATAFQNYGFDNAKSSLSYNVELLRHASCEKLPQRLLTNATIQQFRESRIATPSGWIHVIGASVNGTDLYFSKAYIAGTCEKYVAGSSTLTTDGKVIRNE